MPPRDTGAGTNRAALSLNGPSIQFRWLITLAFGPRGRINACSQAREARLSLRSKSREHLPIGSIELGKNFIDARKHSPDNFDGFAPKGVEFEPQLHYIPLAFFTATIEIVHAPPNYPVSIRNCSNSPRKFNGGPLLPLLMIGTTA